MDERIEAVQRMQINKSPFRGSLLTYLLTICGTNSIIFV